MSKGVRIKDPVIELLAIALYRESWMYNSSNPISWRERNDEDREVFREIARGECDL